MLEVTADDDGNTFRAVYTVKFARAVYVLHAFQKKSKRGRQTPKAELDLVRSRLKWAEEHYESWRGAQQRPTGEEDTAGGSRTGPRR